MATMVKEKDRQKKKTKHKKVTISCENEDQSLSESLEASVSSIRPEEQAPSSLENIPENVATENLTADTILENISETPEQIVEYPDISNLELNCVEVPCSENVSALTAQLEKMAEIKMREQELFKRNAELIASMKIPEESEKSVKDNAQENVEDSSGPIEDVAPSAPMLEEEIQVQEEVVKEIKETKPKLKCMPIEEAIKIYAGSDMAAVKAMSEREEMLVEAGPVSGPEHPLVDLLSTFRSSLRALDNERSRLSCDVDKEDRLRSFLWKIDRRDITKEVECKCGNTVTLTASYEHATYLVHRLPGAKLRLDSLLRDVQDSYCHHQYTAILTHFQIEELISETIESNKPAIREALSLMLQALRVSDNVLLAAALQRWAAALVAALVDQRDVRQILFVIHHLFRQSRSIAWAARVLQPGPGTHTTLAVLDVLLAGSKREAAAECTEDMEEAWEEVSASGVSGAVSENSLRETDLLALFRVFPIREIVANIVMIKSADIRTASPLTWGDVSGGDDVITACSGARTLLMTLHRAVLAHPQYYKLNDTLRQVAAVLLRVLECYYRSNRVPYTPEFQERISAEMESCFIAAFVMFGARDLNKLNTQLLTVDSSKHYCLTYIVALHDKKPKRIESLSIEVPVLTCAERVRIVTYASIYRESDQELARIVLDFLIQTGIKNKSPVCVGGCGAEARASLPKLLATHDYLRVAALYNVAEIARVESLDASVVSTLSVKSWRPQPEELLSLLTEWARKCPTLLTHLLMEIDCTPYTGISHSAQLTLLQFIVEWPGPVDPRWRALRRLRTHPVCWNMSTPCIDGPETQPVDMFECAYVLLATSWGHSIPLICSYGVSALSQLLSRPREAVHCLAPIMLVMANSPESISLTPKFSEIFTSLVNSGPSLVQRALGRGGVSGTDLILRLALAQVDGQPSGSNKSHIVSAWLHALSRTNAASVLDTVAAAARDWTTIDAHATLLLQEENAKDHINSAIRNASTAPLFCESMLRAHYTMKEFNTRLFGTVSNILWQQQVNGQKIHVDNALQKIKSTISSEELTIYRCAVVALAAPVQHPAHLTVWRLLLHLYLQRPPDNMHEAAVPVGPLFFSGIIKSRTLSQLKKRLQETAAYHHNEIETYKKSLGEFKQESNRVAEPKSITNRNVLLTELSIKDFTGESEESESETSDEEVKIEGKKDDGREKERQKIVDMMNYHTGAERMITEYIVWLDEGDRVRASPHHADIARFIPEPVLEAAWKHHVSRFRPPPSYIDEFPLPSPPPIVREQNDTTPLKQAVDAIFGIEDMSGIRSRRLIKSPLGEVDFKDTRRILSVVDKHLNDVDILAKEWGKEVSFISTLDSKLWELNKSLRVARAIPPVSKPCLHVVNDKKCQRTVKFYFSEREWCISTGTERAIEENRASWTSGIRRLSRPRPQSARTAAALHTIARRIQDNGTARCAVERAFVHAREDACPTATSVITAFVELLVQRCISNNGRVCAELLSRWSSEQTSGSQQALCGTLVCPRHVQHEQWTVLYNAVLRAQLPANTIFSLLSKFDLPTWSRSTTPNARQDLLSSLITSQQQTKDSNVLLELLGVHTSILIDASNLSSTVMMFNEASANVRMPPEQWTHFNKAVDGKAKDLSFDELGHLLRELGTLWWKVRSGRSTSVACYAPHVAKLLRALLRAFVAAGVALSYSAERVGYNTWSAVQESWSPWIAPHSSPLLSSLNTDGTSYTDMVGQFVACLQDLVELCPEMETKLLQEIFPWCAHAHAHAQPSPEGRVQIAELLHALLTLRWGRLNINDTCLDIVTQISLTNDKEIQSWCSTVLRHGRLETMLCDVTATSLLHRLPTWLHLFTHTNMNHSIELVEQVTLLPWWQLPEQVLDDALDSFFLVHYNTAVPYHQIPQFRVLLSASELQIQSPGRINASSRTKRTHTVSQWTRAATVPALNAHVTGYCRELLWIIDALAPYLDRTSGELEELLSRASVIMCIEPADSAALPVWKEYISKSSGVIAAASITATCSLTIPAHAASLADTAIKRHMELNESGWSEAIERWRISSPWQTPGTFITHACAHAAYVCAHAHAHAAVTRDVFVALQWGKMQFVEDEVIIAVWICYACRVALDCSTNATSDSATSDSATSDSATECGHAARSLLASWAQAPRRSLLKVVTLQQDTERTTPQHRVLCRLAECILSPSKESIQNYTSALNSLGSHNDVISWGSQAQPGLLPRLAVRFYPKYERYFRIELDYARNK